jgi:hypothetical protein
MSRNSGGSCYFLKVGLGIGLLYIQLMRRPNSISFSAATQPLSFNVHSRVKLPHFKVEFCLVTTGKYLNQLLRDLNI